MPATTAVANIVLIQNLPRAMTPQLKQGKPEFV
jgi:hypothetical protein